jgi:hypothetical protein
MKKDKREKKRRKSKRKDAAIDIGSLTPTPIIEKTAIHLNYM